MACTRLILSSLHSIPFSVRRLLKPYSQTTDDSEERKTLTCNNPSRVLKSSIYVILNRLDCGLSLSYVDCDIKPGI